MDKTKPFFPNYVTKQRPTGVLWDNKFRLILQNSSVYAQRPAFRHFPSLNATSGKKSSRLMSKAKAACPWLQAFYKVFNRFSLL
jgi:hypothetical protein